MLCSTNDQFEGLRLKGQPKGPESSKNTEGLLPSTEIEPVTFRFMVETVTAERDRQLHYKGFDFSSCAVVTMPQAVRLVPSR